MIPDRYTLDHSYSSDNVSRAEQSAHGVRGQRFLRSEGRTRGSNSDQFPFDGSGEALIR
jgi:hypothetical protein